MRRAFTLIELLMVILILGLLAAIVVPQFRDFDGESRRTAFISSARTFVEAAKRYQLDYGVYPAAAAGVLPPGFGDYIQSSRWEGKTPIGGEWEAVVNSGGVVAALGVRYPGGDPDFDAATMQLIDDAADDGDLTTGGFRQFGPRRYYFVVEM